MAGRGRVLAATMGVTAALGLALTLVTGFEGRVLRVYPDPVTHGAPWTYCDGATAAPRFGHRYTNAECDAVTLATLKTTEAALSACLGPVDLPPGVAAAFLSLAYNIGTGAFCASGVARAVRAGDLATACTRIGAFTHAGGRVIAGLVNRRAVEVARCRMALAATPQAGVSQAP